MAQDWLSILEAAYLTEADEEVWLRGILEAAGPMLDHGAGIAAMLYDASSAVSLVPTRFISVGAPGGLDSRDCMRLVEEGAPNPEFLFATFGSLTCALVAESFGVQFPQILDHLRPYGVSDMLAINGVDPSLRGCFLTGNLPDRKRIAARTRSMWNRVSAHLASSYRLRRKLGEIDAVVTPGGKVEHAEGAAKEKDARVTLKDAVKEIEHARGKMRREDPDGAMRAWRGLVDARWTLVDHFESDGKRYVVAKSNSSDTNPHPQLSERERQVLAFVALGHANKLIAYELGLATSTVGVLINRASKKLGARSRSELIQLYRKQHA